MNDKERIKALEEELDYLRKEKRAVLHAIELAADLSNFRTSLNKIDDPQIIIKETAFRVRRILALKSMSFFLVSETDSDFYQAYTYPKSEAKQIEKEINALINDKTFAWALRRNKPVIVSSVNKKDKIILHSMNTSSRTRGIFIGTLASLKKEILDLSLFLFSITIIACSNGLESFELYKQIKNQNELLEDHIRQLEKSAEKLEEEERKYHALFEQSTNSIILYNMRTRLPVDFNHSAYEELGYTKEEFKKLRLEHYSLTPLETIKKRIREIKKRGQATFEAKHRKKNGDVIHNAVNARPITIGGKTYLMTLLNNISGQKKAEAERIHLEKQLLKAQKMEAIGTLAGGIAHDFNNILGVVQGYAQLSLMDLPNPRDRVRKNIQSLVKAVERAKDLVRQILTFSRHGDEDLGPIDMNLIVKETVKLLRATIPKTIKIQYSIPLEPTLVLSIATHIHQVIMNLCTNALHAMKDRYGILRIELSTKTIEVSKEGQDASMADYKKLQSGRYARLVIADTGHGIDTAMMDRIFDPYFTTKEPGEGTGLGLSVVHGILKRYRGDIDIKSTPGKGTTVTVLLPTSESKEKKPVPSLEELPTGIETLLLVDDEEELLTANRQILERLNYTVVACSDSITALKVFRKDPAGFDLVITDMIMPGMTGAELSREIIDTRADIPIILCTGFSEFIDAKKAKAIGIREYLMKPVNNHTLAETIRYVLDELEEPPTKT